MAGVVLSNRTERLERMRGFIAMTFTNLHTTAASQIALGSVIEVNGTFLEFQANEAIDTAAAWGGFANDTEVHCYINGSNYQSYLTITRPVWDSAKQGLYASGTSNRYYGTIYKNSAGDYTRKFIYGLISEGGHILNQVNGGVEFHATRYMPGYILADGSTIDTAVNPEYSRLIHILRLEVSESGLGAAHPYYSATATQAVLPNAQGAALRGIDIAGTRDQDGTRASGNYQADEVKEHDHNLECEGGGGAVATVAETISDNAQSLANIVDTGGTGTENLVKNLALYAMVKF